MKWLKIDKRKRSFISFNYLTLHGSLIITIVATIALLLGFFLNFTPYFETNDDVAMMLVANGYLNGGIPSEHLIFANIVIGLALSKLYTFFPNFNWYTYYLYGIHTIGIFIFIYSLIGIAKRNILIFVSLLLSFAYFELGLLMNLQYTSTSILLGLSCLVFFVLNVNKKSARLLFIVGCIFGLVYTIRVSSFYLLLILYIPVFLYMCKNRNMRKKTIVFILGSFLVFLSSYSINKLYYINDNAWQEYFEYNKIRGDLLDSPRLKEDKHLEEVLDKISWTHQDLRMFKSWFFQEREIFAKDKLQYIYDNRKYTKKEKSIGDSFKNVIKEYELNCIFLLVCFALSLFFIKRRSLLLLNLVTTLVHFGVIIGLETIRHLPSRVMYPITLSYLLFTLLLVYINRNKKSLNLILISFLILPYFAHLLDRRINNYQHNTNRNKFLPILEKLEEIQLQNKRKILFLNWGGSIPLELIMPFGRHHEFPKLDILGLGWRTRSPDFNRILDKYSIDNLVEALGKRNDVYFVTRPIMLSLIEERLKSRYNIDANFELVTNIHNYYNVYRNTGVR